jgi:hypothetical protein
MDANMLRDTRLDGYLVAREDAASLPVAICGDDYVTGAALARAAMV